MRAVLGTVRKISDSVIWLADIGSAVYDSKSILISAQASSPFAIALSPSGTTLFVMNNTGDIIYQYTLSTAFDISTASYASKSFAVTSQETNPVGLFVRPDGKKMYVVGGTFDTVYEYDLLIAWDVTTAEYSELSKNIGSQAATPRSVTLNFTGEVMYVTGVGVVYEYSLSEAWNVSTATYVRNKTFTEVSNGAGTFLVSPDGMMGYLSSFVNNAIYEYSLSEAYNVSTAVYSSESVATIGELPFGFTFNSDGSKLYACCNDNQRIYQFSTVSV